MKYALTYLAVLATFLILDGVWLGVIAKDKYSQWIGHLMADNVVWGAALGFYLLFIFGIIYWSQFASKNYAFSRRGFSK